MYVQRRYRHFDIHPIVVPADQTTTIEIRPRQRQCAADEYQVEYFPVDGYGPDATWGAPHIQTVKRTDGVIRFDLHFHGEQEHWIKLIWRWPNGHERSQEFSLYSLRDDLLARRAYKGDIHLHTCYSDGVSSPSYLAGACRRRGLDFIAVTDHGMYQPSLIAIDAFKDVAIDLTLMPGEEVHLPKTAVHILNVSGRESVNMGGPDDHEPHAKEITALAERLGPLPTGVDPLAYAECVWAFDRIRAVGGLGVFCHPYWKTGRRYHPGGPLTDHIFDTEIFDAYEVIGGYAAKDDSNTLQVARYYEERLAGKTIPIIGVTDTHSCDDEATDRFDWFYSIVFSRSCEPADLIASIKDLYSVGVENISHDRPRPVGPLRLIQFALFCEREIFPQHNELCIEEGRLMQAHGAGDDSAADGLARLSGRTKALYDRLWASPESS